MAKKKEFAAYVMRRPGTTSSPFRRTFTDAKGRTEKLVFAPGVPVGVTAEQAEFLRDDIAKGALAPCLDGDLDAPKADEDLVAVIKEEFDSDQQAERASQLGVYVDGSVDEILPTPPVKPVETAPVTRPANSETTSSTNQ